jgi:hypothetical protein
MSLATTNLPDRRLSTIRLADFHSLTWGIITKSQNSRQDRRFFSLHGTTFFPDPLVQRKRFGTFSLCRVGRFPE